MLERYVMRGLPWLAMRNASIAAAVAVRRMTLLFWWWGHAEGDALLSIWVTQTESSNGVTCRTFTSSGVRRLVALDKRCGELHQMVTQDGERKRRLCALHRYLMLLWPERDLDLVAVAIVSQRRDVRR